MRLRTALNEYKQERADPSRYPGERRTTDGQLLEVRSFSNFKTVAGISLPHSVRFRRPSEKRAARLDYKAITLNPSGLSYDLGVPNGVPRKPLRSSR